MSDTIATLERARSLIAKGWTQGSYASNARGDAVTVTHAEATCFCATGAIARAALGLSGFTIDARTKLTEAIREHASSDGVVPWGNVGIVDWNDHHGRTQAEVVAMFGHAIDLAHADGEPVTW